MKYKSAAEVPNDVLCRRLRELSKAVTKGEKGMREFYMSIPARCEIDADLVLAEAARRIEENSNFFVLLDQCAKQSMDKLKDRTKTKRKT